MELFGINFEKYSHNILIENPPNKKRFSELEKYIDSSYTIPEESYILRNYGSVEKCRAFYRKLHPLYGEYGELYKKIHNAEYLQNRVWKAMRKIILLKIFIAKWRYNFMRKYYEPIYGKGYKKAFLGYTRWTTKGLEEI